MYSTPKLEQFPRIRNTLEEGMSTEFLNKALAVHPQLGPQPYYFRYYINTHEDKHPAQKSYNLKKASALCLQELPNQAHHHHQRERKGTCDEVYKHSIILSFGLPLIQGTQSYKGRWGVSNNSYINVRTI